MSFHIIRVYRERADMGPRPETTRSFFYRDLGELSGANWEPNTDIFETEHEVIIRTELAGVAKQDISIKIKQGKLLISGVRRTPTSTDKVVFHQIEIKCGAFIKIIPLPHALEHNEISARFEDGILDIRISKQSEVIEIPIRIDPMTVTDH